MKREPDYVPAPDAVLTKADVARWLKVHERTVQRLIHTRGLPVLDLTARQPRFLASQVKAWMTAPAKAA